MRYRAENGESKWKSLYTLNGKIFLPVSRTPTASWITPRQKSEGSLSVEIEQSKEKKILSYGVPQPKSKPACGSPLDHPASQ